MENDILNIVNEELTSTGYRVIDISLKGDKNNKILDLFVDAEENILLDELASINIKLRKLLEKDYSYLKIAKITISSPGVERPFKYCWQMKKHTGRIISIKLKNGYEIRGKLTGVNDKEDSISVLVKSINNNSVRKENVFQKIILFSEILESKIIIKI